MAAISVDTNLSETMTVLVGGLAKLFDKEYLLRPVAQEQIRLMHDRIHEQGLASDGNGIGTYSTGYLALRERKYNRTADTKVIVSLTRQLENDYAVIDTPGGMGVGFNNQHNLDKMRWVEVGKGRKIGDATQEELGAAIDFINELTEDAVNP